ncbi:MAG: hypothetical protein U0S36_07280 [Candidatus Nanopelagicales bacterium]|jgi:hypothetical protein
MTGASDAHDAHDEHGDHPVSATIVGLVIVAIFAAIFAAMTTKSFDGLVAVTTVLMLGWLLTSIWALDRD